MTYRLRGTVTYEALRDINLPPEVARFLLINNVPIHPPPTPEGRDFYWFTYLDGINWELEPVHVDYAPTVEDLPD